MILITGGLGYVGSFTIKLLKTKKIISIDDLSRGNLFVNNLCKNFRININKSKKVYKIIKKYKIKTVLHLAAFTCVRESKFKKNLYKNNNLINQKIFLDNMVKAGVKNIIFSSSNSVQGYKSNKKKFSPYAKYKFLIEEYLRKISKKYIKVIILRYPNIAGSSFDGSLGEKNNKISRIFPTFYKNILLKKKTTLFYDRKRRKFPRRSYIHVVDIAKLNIKVIKNIKNIERNFSIININNNITFSNKQIYDLISKKIGPGKIEIKNINKIEKLNILKLNSLKFFKIIGWYRKFSSINQILYSNLKWFKKIYVKKF